jgi:hypothetical protein
VTQRDGPTTQESALTLLRKAEADLQSARELVQGRATKAKKHQAYRLLSGVQSACEVLKIAIDPW